MFARRVATATAALLIGALIVPFSSVAAPAAPDTTQLQAGAAKAPKTAASDITFGVTLSLPPEVAAFEGRVLVKGDAAEVVGVAPEGRGTPLRPEEVQGGWAIGAYDMRSADGATRADIVLVPKRPGRLQVRIVIDAAADIAGRRLELAATEFLARVTVDGDDSALAAPAGSGRGKPERAPKQPKDLLADGKLDARDVDVARAEWGQTRAKGTVCKAGGPGDANDDGCTDVVDIQSLLTRARETGDATGGVVLASAQVAPRADDSAAAAPLRTFVVRSSADTADAAPGNGVCADASGQCTLRAAITEADYLAGEDRIEFQLAGTAPVRIQLTSRLPLITSRSGPVVIDGYSQPGSQPNTAGTGSNAIPGIEIRGNGTAAKEIALFITGPLNTVRGLLFNNIHRGIFIDGTAARDNRIVGNWLGFLPTQAASGGQYGIILNVGANRNFIGTPAPGDRNVIGNWSAGVNVYGPGTDGNTVQNNLFCIRPSGGTANCSTGIDHNFGPKNGLVGGTGPNERNVFGPTSLQGIELSHGFNSATGEYSATYQINGNRVLGNWVGFRADGSYDPLYRSGLNSSSGDNAQAINVYDGANENTVEANHVGSVYDGIQTMSPTSQRNIIRNNIIGESPLGQAAPMSRWGIVVRWGSAHSTVESNTIKNAAAGGIGLLNVNNRNEPQSPAYNIRLSRNIVLNTSGPAIDLFGVAGPDANDAGDGDTGANTLLNTPVITLASTSSVRGTGNPGAAVEVFRASRSAGQFGLPTAYLGTATVASNGTWTLAVASSTGQLVTAVQILPDRNTSELSPNVAVGSATSEAPTITSATSTRFVAGTAGSFTVTSVGNPTPTVSMTGTLPAGVTFLAGTNGTATLSGTPAAGTSGAYPLTFTAANGVSPNATQSFTLQVDAAPKITSGSSATFVVGSAGDFDVTATGRPAPTLSASGSLPSGVTFTPGGAGSASISGTPAAGTDGTYTITITASNGVSPNATQQFTLTVNPAPSSGTIASDTFSRTISGGWGSAEQGGVWTAPTGSWAFSTDGSRARITLSAGHTRLGRLDGATATSSDVRVKVAADKLPIANNLFYYVVGRRTATDTEYRAKIRIAPDGTVYVQPTKAVANAVTVLGPEVQVPGLVAGAETQLSVRVQFVGTSPTVVRMRVWRAADAEPTTWHASYSDAESALQSSGGFGLRTYLSSAVTNAPIVVSFDDLTITP